MSVIVIDGDQVWGASSGLIYSLIENFISIVGDKDYLIKFKESYDNGYRIVYLNESSDQELEEFLKLLKQYINNRRDEIFEKTDRERNIIRDSLLGLASLVEDALVKRKAG